MKILKYKENLILPDKDRYIALGVFDGVHLGHQKLINLTVSKAKSNNGASIIVTFDPHPDTVVIPENNVFLLTTLEEKIDIIKDLNVDILVIIRFTRTISRMSPKEFIRNILVNNLKVKELFVGFNYKFGFQRKGNINCLKDYGKIYNFTPNILEPEIVNNTIISSTRIKEYIKTGDIEKAKILLGHHIMLNGKVIRGKNRGKKLLNFATANVEVPLEKILPANGVYFVEIFIDNDKYYGLMNIGIKPTFRETERTVEIHIIDFNRDIYNQEISVNVLKKIRDEILFDNPQMLREQIEKDILIAYEMIKKE